MQWLWRIELLGTLKANRDGHEVTRFRTRRVASLLAYLAYFRQGLHSRDQISEMLWPDADSEASRRNLRQALSSMRLAIEPAPLPKGSVVQSIHDGVQLNPETVTTDVAEFESLVQQGKREEDPKRVIQYLTRAVSLYKGDLLPGFNDEWIWAHRLRLEDLYLSALKRLSAVEDSDAAIDHLRQGVIREPFNEHWHIELMRRYLHTDRPESALDQFSELEGVLADSFGQIPSEEARGLVAQARASTNTVSSTTRPTRAPSPSIEVIEPTVSVPMTFNRYFGREDEKRFICATLEESRSRLVTILGPAGVGKTRLSIQCARAIAARTSWNVWFVPLADRFNATEINEAIIATMDPRHGASSGEIRRIAELTFGRQTLFVLDNLEQIAHEAGAIIAELLQAIPNVVCLASSRQPLQIAGEQIVPLDPLPLLSEEAGLNELAANPSVQLFVDRCQAIRPDLQLSERNAASILDLCARLDGLPLAIEIAAGLSNTYSPAQMLLHLPPHLTDLTTRRRDVPARHKSLGAAIDWSYDSLSEELQRLFRRLSVFRGGFTIAAAANVCFDKDEMACATALQSLHELSLVRGQPDEDGRSPRYSLLVAFREYGEQKLSAEEARELSESHAEYFVSQAPQDRPFASVEEQTERHMAVEWDYDNFTSAIEYSLDSGSLERCVKLLGILYIRWLARGPKATERRLIRKLSQQKALLELSPDLQVQVQRMLGTTFIRSGEYQSAYDACSRAVQIAADAANDHLLATCFSGLSICAGYLGRLEESLELNRKVLKLASSDLALAERSYLGMGSIYGNLGRLAEAGAAFDKARTISERMRGGEPDALIVINQARVALETGRRSEALRLAHESIRISRRLRDEFTLAMGLTVVSRYHAVTGNLEAAVATNLEALDRFKKGDFLFWILNCLRFHALLWVQVGRFQAAATLYAATMEATIGDSKLDAAEEQKAIASIRGALSSREFETAWAKGLGMDRSAAIQFVTTNIDSLLGSQNITGL